MDEVNRALNRGEVGVNSTDEHGTTALQVSYPLYPRPWYNMYLLGVGKVAGSMLGPNCIIAKDVKRCTLCQMRDINSMSKGNALAPGATQYFAQITLPNKGLATKGLVVCNNWGLEPLTC